MDGIATDGRPIEGIATGGIATGTDGIATVGIATGIDGIAIGIDGIATGIDGTAIGIDDTATGREGAAGRLGRFRDGNIGISHSATSVAATAGVVVASAASGLVITSPSAIWLVPQI